MDLLVMRTVNRETCCSVHALLCVCVCVSLCMCGAYQQVWLSRKTLYWMNVKKRAQLGLKLTTLRLLVTKTEVSKDERQSAYSYDCNAR